MNRLASCLGSLIFLLLLTDIHVAQAQLTRTGYAPIIATASGKCMDVVGMSVQENAVVVQWPCQSSVNERWMVQPYGTSFRVIGLQSQKCLNVAGASRSAGANLVQQSCTGQPSELWTFQPAGIAYTLVSTLSSLCIGTNNGDASDGAALVQVSCKDPNLTAWTFKNGLVTPQIPAVLQANHSGQCLTAAAANGTVTVAQNPCAGVPTERWIISPSDTAYQLTSGSTGQCLDLTNASGTTGGAPVTRGCTGSASQRFYFWPNTDGAYVLQSVATGQCVAVTGASSAAGAAIGQAPCAAQGAQQWSISAATLPSSWSSVIPLTSNPIAIANLPNGKLLTWGTFDLYGYEGDIGLSYGQTYYSTFDPANGTSSPSLVNSSGADLFCPGIANLADGRILVNGGSSSPKTTIYDPATGVWTADKNMNIPRGYQGTTLTSNGSVFTLGGSWNSVTGGKNGELWTKAGGWSLLASVPVAPVIGPDPAGTFRGDNHLWLFAAGNGQVFHAGPSAAMNWITTSGAGSINSAGNRGDDAYAINGSAVMYDVKRILKAGGAPAYDYGVATPSSYTIDITNGVSGTNVKKIAPMTYSRAFSSGVALPTGQVLIVGGQTFALGFTDTGAVLTPELWDPLTNAYRQLAPMQTPRTYHSTALLLQDGRVFVGGGGQCGAGCAQNHFNAEILTPPYLLNADGSPATRPTIVTAPAKATAGTSITVTTNAPVASFVLMRNSSVTHSVNNDQRRIPLPIQSNAGYSKVLAIPGDSGVVIPGYYMLFALNAQDVPSVAATILIQ